MKVDRITHSRDMTVRNFPKCEVGRWSVGRSSVLNISVYVRLTDIRSASVGDDLVQKNSKRPDIRLDGEFLVISSFWSCPLYWKHHRYENTHAPTTSVLLVARFFQIFLIIRAHTPARSDLCAVHPCKSCIISRHYSQTRFRLHATLLLIS